MELADVQFEYSNDIAGFLSFGLEKRYVKISPPPPNHHRYFFPVTTYYFFVRLRALNRHVQGERMQTAITLLLGFRNYLHYHIKCSKTYLHMRMRKRVAGWMLPLRMLPSRWDWWNIINPYLRIRRKYLWKVSLGGRNLRPLNLINCREGSG